MEKWWTKKLTVAELEASWRRDNMKKYEVNVEFNANYRIIVEAVNEEEAQQKAENELEWACNDTENISIDDITIEELK